MEKLTQAKELFFSCEFKKAFALFEELAVSGNTTTEIAGTHILGLRNDGDWANSDEAFKWAKIAVERDAEDEDANLWLGVCFLKGIGVPANKKKARKYLQISANLGNETAQALLDDDGNDEED